MPGIVGIICLDRVQDHSALVTQMLAAMQHEPSYVSGTCSEPSLGITAGWIAHKGSFAARVCEGTTDGISLLFAGECFAAADASFDEPSRDPHAWVARSCASADNAAFSRLNGVFSGLLIDRRRRRMHLFNDRFGLERVYIYQSDDTLYFASEAKALLRILPQLREWDSLSLRQYLTFGCTLNWKCVFRGMTMLPPASHWSKGGDGGLERSTYFSPTEWESQPPLSEKDYEEALAATFKRVLPRYTTLSDRLGVSLTGGIDTRMIMACARSSFKVPCYTFSGRTENTLDAKLAAQIAQTLGLSHQVLRIGEDFLPNFFQFVDRSVYVTDGCCGATGAHEIYLNRHASRIAPLRLTGNFGSEIFRSMSTFESQQLARGLLSNDLERELEEFRALEHIAPAHPVTFAAFCEIPWSLVGTLLAARSQISFRTPYLDNELVALAYRVPITYRKSRLPALKLIENVRPELARIPTDRGHIGSDRGALWVLRRVVAELTFKLDYLHKEGLPSAVSGFEPVLNLLNITGVLGKHKFLAYRRWFRNELASKAQEILTDPQTRNLPFVNSSFVESMLRDHRDGRKNYINEINAVLTLESINRLLLRAP